MNPQPLEALAAANEVRAACVAYVQTVRDGGIDPARAITSCKLPVKVSQLLRAIDGVGPVKARNLATAAGVSLDDRIGGAEDGYHRKYRVLTDRERLDLASVVREYLWRREHTASHAFPVVPRRAA